MCYSASIVEGGNAGCGLTSDFYQDWTFEIQDYSNCTIPKNAPSPITFVMKYDYTLVQDVGSEGPTEETLVLIIPSGSHEISYRFDTLNHQFCNFSGLCDGSCYSTITNIRLFASTLGFNCSNCNQPSTTTTTTTFSGTTTTTTQAPGCTALNYNWWEGGGPQTVVTGSTHTYYIYPPTASVASYPQTYSYSAPGSTNRLTNADWIVSSSLQPPFAVSVTWNNTIDTAGLNHSWMITGSNCAGVSATYIYQVNVYDFVVP